MTCERWQELVLDREYLNEVQRRNLDQHLSNCVTCRAWAKALAEAEAVVTDQLLTEMDPTAFRARLLDALARERRQKWMAAVPDVLDALGWSAIGVLGIAALLLWTTWVVWLGNHLVLAGAVGLVGSLACAGVVLWKEESEAGVPL
jgi:predicted anti-sigma-YlaC factor YlaD